MARRVAATETLPRGCQEGALRRRRLRAGSARTTVAAQDDAALAGDAVGQARRQRADAGDRHDAERDAGDEDVKAAQPAAQIAQREPQNGTGASARNVRSRSGSGSRDRPLVDAAGAQPHHAVAALRRARIVVGDQDQRGAALDVAGEQQIDDLRPVASSRLPVGSSATRIAGLRRERARQRDALLLAAGQLRRIVVQRARPSPTAASSRAARSKASAAPASSSGTATFSSAVMVGIRWNDWNTMPTLRPRKRASASSSSAPRSVPATSDRAAVGALQPGHHHQQRGFAGARRPDQADRLAACLYAGRCP